MLRDRTPLKVLLEIVEVGRNGFRSRDPFLGEVPEQDVDATEGGIRWHLAEVSEARAKELAEFVVVPERCGRGVDSRVVGLLQLLEGDLASEDKPVELVQECVLGVWKASLKRLIDKVVFHLGPGVHQHRRYLDFDDGLPVSGLIRR